VVIGEEGGGNKLSIHGEQCPAARMIDQGPNNDGDYLAGSFRQPQQHQLTTDDAAAG